MADQAAGKVENEDSSYRQKWGNWIAQHGWLRLALSALLLILLAVCAAVVLAITLWAIFPEDSPPWTGFGSTPLPLYTGISPYKNLWDWLGLIIVPLALAVGAALIGRAQQNREFRAREFERKLAQEAHQNDWIIEKDRQEQTIIADYYRSMSELMLERGLRSSDASDDVRYIARAITLSVFRGINATRKGQVLRFLYEADLITLPDPVVNLQDADLSNAELESADLHDANLAGANLSEARLSGSNMAGANLIGANLIRVELRRSALGRAVLSNAYLSGAHMREADLNSAVLDNTLLNNASLIEANLQKSDLSRANLVGADLSRAALQGANFSKAKSKPTRAAGKEEEEAKDDTTLVVDQATYDETTIWPPGYDPATHGAVRQ
jgi:uncharacterized protein YjbI with pentapeptide repeats